MIRALTSIGSTDEVWHRIFDFTDYGQLLALVHNSLIAGLVLGLVGGLISTFVMMRDLPFAVHGISELSFAGASAALLLGINVVAGSLVGSILAAGAIGILGVRARDRNSIIGVIMPFGLGLGVLFLSLYKGRAANKFGLLTGQIVAIDTPELSWLLATSAVVVVGLALIWRPLSFVSVDPEVAPRPGPAGGGHLVGLHAPARAGGRAVHPGRRCATGPQRRVYSRGGRDPDHPITGSGAGLQHGLRDDLDRRRDPAVAGQQHPDQSLRHHDLLHHLPGLLGDRVGEATEHPQPDRYRHQQVPRRRMRR